MDMGQDAAPTRALLVSDAGDGDLGADLAPRLSRTDLVVDVAQDWNAAIAQARDYDVVLVTSGPDVAGALGFIEQARREDVPGPKFVFASDSAGPGAESAARDAGAVEVLVGEDATRVSICRAIRHAGVMRRMEGRLADIALFDGLTGLPSQVLFWQFLDHAVQRAARSEERFAVMSIYIEGLTSINAEGGWQLGDRALLRVAKRLRDTLRASDTVARFSGPKFTILLESVREDADAQLVAHRLLDVLSAPMELSDGTTVALGATIGIALHPTTATSAQELLEKSLGAMDYAKDGGAGTIHFA